MADLGINVIFEGRNLVRILEGLGVTVGISALSVVLSLVLGVFVGLGMRSRWRPLRWLMQIYLEFVRIMPQLVLLFVAYFGLTRVAGINLDGITASVLVFTLWGGAEMGDLVRGALIAIPRRQYESDHAPRYPAANPSQARAPGRQPHHPHDQDDLPRRPHRRR